MNLKETKKEYSALAKKYKLPEFNKLNEEFEIEKLEHESETLVRAIRKIMMEKVINSMNFLEMLLNPMNAPRMYMMYVRAMQIDDKKDIDRIYDSFATLSLDALANEIDYSEKNEAELIKRIFAVWNALKPEFRRIIASIKKPISNDIKKEKSYFG
ncbi:hypothetical protein J4217_04415 [Candidatus Pacearchaeota archaeon]|nr:hypothetical protein [Candidatus Pacearchaeota archaeon]